MSSRINYFEIDDLDSLLAAGRWIATSNRVLNGRPAQKHFRELEAALLAMPENKRRLISGAVSRDGAACAVGEMAVNRLKRLGVPRRRAYRQIEKMTSFDYGYGGDVDYGSAEDTAAFGKKMTGMTYTLGWLIAEANDEEFGYATPERRWELMLEWTRKHIRAELVTTT